MKDTNDSRPYFKHIKSIYWDKMKRMNKSYIIPSGKYYIWIKKSLGTTRDVDTDLKS